MQSRQANPQQYVDPIIAKQHIKRVFFASYARIYIPILLLEVITYFVCQANYSPLDTVYYPAVVIFLFTLAMPAMVFLVVKNFNQDLLYRKRGRNAYVKRVSYAGRKNDTTKKANESVKSFSIIFSILFLVIACVFLLNFDREYIAHMLYIAPFLAMFFCFLACLNVFKRIQFGCPKINARTFQPESNPCSFVNDPLDSLNNTGFNKPSSPNAPLSMINQDFNAKITEQNRVFDSMRSDW